MYKKHRFLWSTKIVPKFQTNKITFKRNLPMSKAMIFSIVYTSLPQNLIRNDFEISLVCNIFLQKHEIFFLVKILKKKSWTCADFMKMFQSCQTISFQGNALVQSHLRHFHRQHYWLICFFSVMNQYLWQYQSINKLRQFK